MKYKSKYPSCVGCGYCCLKGPCVMAPKDENKRCLHLEWDEVAGRYWCKAIKASKTTADSLAAGKGCSSSLNTWRKDVKYRG